MKECKPTVSNCSGYNSDDSYSSGDSIVEFSKIDFTGVNFTTEDEDEHEKDEDKDEHEIGEDENNIQHVIKTSDKINEVDRTMKNCDKHLLQSTTIDGDESLKEIPIKTDSIREDDLLPLNGSKHLNTTETTIEMKVINLEPIQCEPSHSNSDDKIAIDLERKILLNDCHCLPGTIEAFKCQVISSDVVQTVLSFSTLLCEGKYADILTSPLASEIFRPLSQGVSESNISATIISNRIRNDVISYCTTATKCVEVEMFGVAALNLFLQLNYTGPSLDEGCERPGAESKEDKISSLNSINPHHVFEGVYTEKEETKNVESINNIQEQKNDFEHDMSKVDLAFRNSILSELSVDGNWPYSLCHFPYFLLLARSILLTLADPSLPDWSHSTLKNNQKIVVCKDEGDDAISFSPPPATFIATRQNLLCSQIWSARAAVAHERLLNTNEPTTTLWNEVEGMYMKCLSIFVEGVGCASVPNIKQENKDLDVKIMLEYGFAEHHFNRNGEGKESFRKALLLSGLHVDVTGAEGKRTKYQQKATAQMLVRAKPSERGDNIAIENNSLTPTEAIQKQMIDHTEETILFDKVNFEEVEDNVHYELSIVEQAVLLALCLDVKNENAMDDLTAEQMGAYLERVLQQHDDWTVYSTGLLERAWLEFERNHTKERAILQIQALSDQHHNRLTLTQSTFESIENSAPAQDRLKNIHYIVYPPRWEILRDLAERYATLGIVTSAAEIFEELELWDEVVVCYTRAGKKSLAEKIVRKRLIEAATPRMWAALGDITNDPQYYERALELSNWRFSPAHVALGKYSFDKGNLEQAVYHFKKALCIKPLSPHIWFRLGAISMRLLHWKTALQAFSEVVQQEPDERDAWANIAAIHMKNKNPSEAYPALNEVS